MGVEGEKARADKRGLVFLPTLLFGKGVGICVEGKGWCGGAKSWGLDFGGLSGLRTRARIDYYK